jgi:serine phosphatase RsbU (regulator of sigma subunit)/anti-sigma regulatory factor (Ser/Thr protein kinase)
MRAAGLEHPPRSVEDACVSVDAGRTPTSGSLPLARRVRLPADRRTPAAARAVVRAILAEARLTELLDEALLLTTELATNGVMHAGTDLDIEVTADNDGVTVTVTDFARGPVERLAAGPIPSDAAARPAEPSSFTVDDPAFDPDVSERGRGLLLVDHFASRWGTTHMPAGKGVWFRLDRWRGDAAPASPDATDATDDGSAPTLAAAVSAGVVAATAPAPSGAALITLLQLVPDAHSEEPLADFARALLARVGALVGAPGAVVRVDRGDGAGPQVLARYGRMPHPDAETLIVPLAVSRPFAGELELDAPPSAYARPLALLVAERLALHLENDRLRRADLRRQSWLTFLAEASELLAQSLDVQLTMALIPQLVVPRLGRWCAVHTADEWGQFNLAATAHADETMLADLHAALKEAGPESVGARLREASRLGTPQPLSQPLEGFALPLIARGQRLGALAVGRHRGHRHDPEEIAVLEDVARRAALAIDNARIHDERRRVAHTLQQSLLPPVLPVVAGIGFAAEYAPSGDAAEVGGDFYDVVPLPDDRWLVVVGDVSGKGAEAAAVTGLVRDVIRVLAQDGRPPRDMLVRLNDTLVERAGGRYCTLVLAAVARRQDGRLDVDLRLAGHDRPVLVRPGALAAFVGSGGTALGLLHVIESPVETLTLESGDALIFYTDGVTERRRGRDLFGIDRLRRAADTLGGYSADVVAARLRNITLGFSEEAPRDDIAILVLRNEP